MATVNEKMTAIADEIRELSGTTGTMGLNAMATYVDDANEEVGSQVDLISQIQVALQTKAAGGEQATPEISVNASGLITATAGIKTSTHQLAFQEAKTITPSTASQIAVSSGYFTGGNVMVAGDANLVAGNIKSGVSIFGVSGTLIEDGGSGEAALWSENEDAMVARTLSSYFNDRITTIGSYAFASCTKLTTASFPAVTIIGSTAFFHCSKLTTVSFPIARSIGANAFFCCGSLTTASFPQTITIGQSAFCSCVNLTTASFPAATSIGNSAFISCSKLTTVSFPVARNIGANAFKTCYNLSQFCLPGSSVCKLSNSNAFASTPYAGYSSYFSGTPYIYVPASLVSAYQTATNWTYFSSYFSAIEIGSGEIFTFAIDGAEYWAEEGMTWGEWVESEYNTDGIIIDNDGNVKKGEYWIWSPDTMSAYCESLNDIIGHGDYRLMDFASMWDD